MIFNLHPTLARTFVNLQQEELMRRAETYRRAQPDPAPAPVARRSAQITLRLARPEDRSAIDGQRSALDLGDTVLVAEVDGKVVGACSLDGTHGFGRAADPSVGDLLALRAAQLRPARRRAVRFRRAAPGGY